MAARVNAGYNAAECVAEYKRLLTQGIDTFLCESEELSQPGQFTTVTSSREFERNFGATNHMKGVALVVAQAFRAMYPNVADTVEKNVRPEGREALKFVALPAPVESDKREDLFNIFREQGVFKSDEETQLRQSNRFAAVLIVVLNESGSDSSFTPTSAAFTQNGDSLRLTVTTIEGKVVTIRTAGKDAPVETAIV